MTVEIETSVRHNTTSQHLWLYFKPMCLTGRVYPCRCFVLHWTSRNSSKASPQEGTAGLPSHPEAPINTHTHTHITHQNTKITTHLTSSTHTHLTMLSVDQLICVYVLRMESIWQRFTLIFELRELRQTARCIWNTHIKKCWCRVRLYVQKRVLLPHFVFVLPKNCWYWWTWALMSDSPAPCWCPNPRPIPLVSPSTFCTGFILYQEMRAAVKLTTAGV